MKKPTFYICLHFTLYQMSCVKLVMPMPCPGPTIGTSTTRQLEYQFVCDRWTRLQESVFSGRVFKGSHTKDFRTDEEQLRLVVSCDDIFAVRRRRLHW